MGITIVISEDREGEAALQSLRDGLLARLARWPDAEVKIVPYLYDLDPDGPGMNGMRSAGGDMVVLAPLYPRTIYWLLHANEVRGRLGPSELMHADEADASSEDSGRDAPGRTIWCLDLRGQGAEPLSAELERIVTESIGDPPARLPPDGQSAPADVVRIEEIASPRWYPIVDFGRCRNCLECLNFCLFGVFGIDAEDRLFVEQADACRDGCPACARVCPAQAIMFPKHSNPGIAGDPKATAADMNVSLVQLLGQASSGGLAAVERDRALAEKTKSESHSSRKMDDLDALVNDLDEMNL